MEPQNLLTCRRSCHAHARAQKVHARSAAWFDLEDPHTPLGRSGRDPDAQRIAPSIMNFLTPPQHLLKRAERARAAFVSNRCGQPADCNEKPFAHAKFPSRAGNMWSPASAEYSCPLWQKITVTSFLKPLDGKGGFDISAFRKTIPTSAVSHRNPDPVSGHQASMALVYLPEIKRWRQAHPDDSTVSSAAYCHVPHFPQQGKRAATLAAGGAAGQAAMTTRAIAWIAQQSVPSPARTCLVSSALRDLRLSDRDQLTSPYLHFAKWTPPYQTIIGGN